MFLTRISVAHPVFATMMMVTIMVVGLFSYGRLGVDQYPETDLPIVVVTATYTGASPASIESEVSRPIESSLNTIGGIDTITSGSYEGRSIVVVHFDLNTDSQVAAQEVRDRVARLEAGFPDGVDTPQVTRFNPDEWNAPASHLKRPATTSKCSASCESGEASEATMRKIPAVV